MAQGGTSGGGSGAAPAAAPSGNTGGSGLVGGIKPTTAAPAPQAVGIAASKSHPGATFTGTESSRNAALVSTAKGEFGGWEARASDRLGAKITKPASNAATAKPADTKGIKIEQPVETRSAFDYMQPGALQEKPGGAQEDAQKLNTGSVDTSLTPGQLSEVMGNRENLLKLMHKFGRIGPGGEHYYIMLEELNKTLGLSQTDTGNYSVPDSPGGSDS